MEGTQLGFESESTRGFSFYEAIKRLRLCFKIVLKLA